MPEELCAFNRLSFLIPHTDIDIVDEEIVCRFIDTDRKSPGGQRDRVCQHEDAQIGLQSRMHPYDTGSDLHRDDPVCDIKVGFCKFHKEGTRYVDQQKQQPKGGKKSVTLIPAQEFSCYKSGKQCEHNTHDKFRERP